MGVKLRECILIPSALPRRGEPQVNPVWRRRRRSRRRSSSRRRRRKRRRRSLEHRSASLQTGFYIHVVSFIVARTDVRATTKPASTVIWSPESDSSTAETASRAHSLISFFLSLFFRAGEGCGKCWAPRTCWTLQVPSPSHRPGDREAERVLTGECEGFTNSGGSIVKWGFPLSHLSAKVKGCVFALVSNWVYKAKLRLWDKNFKKSINQ